jgi:C1A family cysteine protease
MNRKLTYMKSEPTHNFSIMEKVTLTEKLPTSYSLLKYLPPVIEQGNLGSCTGCALASSVKILANIYNLKIKNKNLSPLFIYYCEREILGTINIDSGSSISAGITSLQQIGVCNEIFHPYNISKFKLRPHKKAYDNAKTYQIDEVIKVPYDLNTIKSILLTRPIVIGINVYKSFILNKNVDITGNIPYPNLESSEEELLGGHAMYLFGYNENNKTFLVRNSWGIDWGNEGSGTIPEKYIINEDLNLEMWACVSFKNLIPNKNPKQKKKKD